MRVPFLDVSAGYRELKAQLDAAYERVAASGPYVLGSELELFESEFAAYCGTTHAVGVANGLDALELILRALTIGRGDEVIVPTNTFIATWLAVTATGATPVGVEPFEATHNIDPERLEAAVTSRTRAIIAVHLYGQPADMDRVRAVGHRHGIAVIEDAAQSHGARYRDRPTGGLGLAAAWSFYPAKNLGALGDGGAVTTNDSSLAQRLRILRNYGSLRKYHHDVVGINSRLDPLQAAFLRVKLRVLDDWNRRRGRIAERYLAELPRDCRVHLPRIADGATPAWHLFVVTSINRDEMQRHLAGAGIDTLVHYPIPPHMSGAYRLPEGATSAFPIAERLAGRVLSLPIGPHLSDEDVTAVIASVEVFVNA